MEKIFIYREKYQHRDCCVYLDYYDFKVGRVSLHGPCFLGRTMPDYDKVETYLTEDQYEQLRHRENISVLEDVLLSEGAKKFTEKIMENEKSVIMEDFGLSKEQVDYILDQYVGPYMDRGIICCTYESYEELGEETADMLGYFTRLDKSTLRRYFDFSSFGKDIATEHDDEFFVFEQDGEVIIAQVNL